MDKEEKEFLFWGVPIQFFLSFLYLPEFNLIERIILAVCATLIGCLVVFNIVKPLNNYLLKLFRPKVHTGMERLKKFLKLK